MKLHVLFIQRLEEDVPEAIRVWDEYAVDSNPEGYEEDMAKTIKAHGTDVVHHKIISIEVSESEILKYLSQTPTLPGSIVEE